MKITKYLHSCLLIEDKDKTVLIDPGIFTYETKSLESNQLSKLDYILITHEHPDHCHPIFIQELIKKFPQVKIMTNSSVVTLLQNNQVNSTTEGDEHVKITAVQHERVFDKEAPPNVMFEVFDRLAHPGDSISFTTDKEILALPLLGPSWMITQAVEKAVALKPKIILPIHDYHWKDQYRIAYYQRMGAFFKPLGSEFKSLETGKVLEV